MHGMQVVDRKIAVEQAAVAERAQEPGDANPYAQIQAHQLQHVMAAQIQQSSLAAQVAAMRVQAKTNPASAAAPGALPPPQMQALLLVSIAVSYTQITPLHLLHTLSCECHRYGKIMIAHMKMR